VNKVTGKAYLESHWLEDWTIPAVAAVMRAAWMSPILHIAVNNPFVHPSGIIVPGWWLLALLLVPVFLQRLSLPRPWLVAVLITLGLVAIPGSWAVAFGADTGAPLAWLVEQVRALTDWRVGMSTGLILALATILIWQRGISGASMHYGDLWASFVWGSIALGTMLLLPSDTLAGIAGVDVMTSLMLFVLTGLVGLALFALTGTLATENLRTSVPLGISRSWLAVVGTTAVAVLLLGWAAGLVLAPDMLARSLSYLKPVWDLLILVIAGVGALLAYAVLWLITPIFQSAYSRIMPLLRRDDLGNLRRFLLEDLRIGQREPPRLAPAFEVAWRPLAAIALVGLALWWIARALRGRGRPGEGEVVETRESMLTPALVRTQLEGLLRRRKPASRFLPLDVEHSTRDAIRATYQGLLARAIEVGIPRQREQTPERYGRGLAERWPEHQRALHALTRIYVLARYGVDNPTATDVSEARAAFEAMQRPQPEALRAERDKRFR
jgi:hypothetical protein